MPCNPVKNNPLKNSSLEQQQGFTLIEMVIGIIVFSIAMVMMVSVIMPRSEQSVDPIFQVRATKLATTLLNEISSKAFDHNSYLSQGEFRCDEDNGDDAIDNSCTEATNFGAEAGESPINFNDVDDYDNFQATGTPLGGSESYDTLYSGYSYDINVSYDGNYDGVSDANKNAKLITITVTMPNDETLDFAIYRGNY